MKVTYKMFKRDDQGDFVTVHDLSIDPKKCSLTRAAENPILENINLDHFYCVDFDEIKKKGGFETDVPLYGDYDEDVVSYIYFQGSNCQINTETDAIYDCLSLEEVTERNNRKSYQFVHLMLPRFNFRPASFEEPMSSYLESSFVKLSPFAFTTDEIRYSKVILENDVGWIFEDVQELFSAEKTQQNRSFNSIIADSYNLNDINLIYFADFMFTKKQLNYKRSYMKIQELAANVGGVSKFFVQFFGFISQQVGTLILDNKLIGIFFTDASTSRVINRIQLNRSSSNFEAERKKQVIKITFSHFLSTRICCKKKNAYAMAAEEVKSTFDVVEIYKNHLRVLYLSDVLLDEENKNKMDASLKRAIELSQEEEQPVMNESGEVVNAKRS